MLVQNALLFILHNFFVRHENKFFYRYDNKFLLFRQMSHVCTDNPCKTCTTIIVFMPYIVCASIQLHHQSQRNIQLLALSKEYLK